jgi:hypothetical protein
MSDEERSNATTEVDDDDEVEEESFPQSIAFGEMLDSVLSRHLEYSQDDNTLSLAEILLLIKQSIDAQNSILSEMLRLKMAKYGMTNASAAASSSASHHSRRQETPEERAIRKAKEAARAK